MFSFGRCLAPFHPIQLSILLTLFVAGSLYAGSEGVDVCLNEGDVVPEFEAKTANGDVWKSVDHIGKKYVVVYFYPADLTNGCTQQACAYRDMKEALESADVEVVGISGDSPQNHALFTRMHSLNFTLLADQEGRIAKSFGVPFREGDTITRMVDGVEHSFTRGVTASRWTFVIGKDGKIVKKSTAVEPQKDCQIVLETVRRLTADAE
ncbi:MAG: peroxiredoxin [Planctomycetaceae bacterium]